MTERWKKQLGVLDWRGHTKARVHSSGVVEGMRGKKDDRYWGRGGGEKLKHGCESCCEGKTKNNNGK